MDQTEAEGWVRAALLKALRSPKKVARAIERGALPLGVDEARAVLVARGLTAWVPPAGAGPVLVVCGKLPEGVRVAVVGSRAVDPYGQVVATRVARDVVRLGGVVVSGGAEGCDAAAHRGAMEAGGATVVVLGGGHDRPYPACHRGLFREVVERGGAVVSPYWPDERVAGFRLLERNGVIAALSCATVVVRSALRGGALRTARDAKRLGRPVWAVPGDVGAWLSQGCHRLLAQGARALVGAESVATLMGARSSVGGWPVGGAGSAVPWRPIVVDAAEDLAPGHRAIVAAVAENPGLDLEGLVMRTGVPVDAVAAAVLDLELEGMIHRLPGDRFAAV